MHATAYLIGKEFLNLYWKEGFRTVLDLGAYDMNGSLRDCKPEGAAYIGVDLEAGPGVDLVKPIDGPIPLANGAADVAVCSSVFEHDRFFWETILELCRVVRPGGYIYVNAPSNGWFHLHPEDCWRFYPDAGISLAAWATRQGFPLTLVESFICEQVDDVWNDFVAVFSRDPSPVPPEKFLYQQFPTYNIHELGRAGRLRLRHESQDISRIRKLSAKVIELENQVQRLQGKLDEVAGVLSR